MHKPGVGVGGACIPTYPQFILHTADKIKLACKMTKLSRIINDSMPAYSVQQAVKLINGRKKIAYCDVTLLGLAFRGGVSDTRLSPTYKVIKEFKKLKVKEIRIHDPLVKRDPFLRNERNIFLTSSLSEALKNTDLIMLIADSS